MLFKWFKWDLSMQNEKEKYRLNYSKKKKKALFEWDTKNSPVGKDGQCFNYICLTFI